MANCFPQSSFHYRSEGFIFRVRTIIGNDSVNHVSLSMKNVKDVVEKITNEIQSMIVSVGNTVYSVQVMENSIAKVDDDAQNMKNFVEST